MDFEYTVELMFNEQAQQFVHRKCEYTAHHALRLLTSGAGLEAPVEWTKGIRSLVSSQKCHLLLLTVPEAKERAVVPAGFMQEGCPWDSADVLFRAVADHGRTPSVVCKQL